MPYPVYANKEDLVNYLGLKDDTTLPADIERLLKRASEIIYYVTFGNVRLEKQNHVDATKQATCAQIEYWMQTTEQVAISGQNVDSFSLGDLSMTFDKNETSTSSSKQIAPRAKQYLSMEGLMYRGIGW